MSNGDFIFHLSGKLQNMSRQTMFIPIESKFGYMYHAKNDDFFQILARIDDFFVMIFQNLTKTNDF